MSNANKRVMIGGGIAAALTAAMASGSNMMIWPRGMGKSNPKMKKTKPCLQCNRPHDHNNCWCSSECCKIWRAAN